MSKFKKKVMCQVLFRVVCVCGEKCDLVVSDTVLTRADMFEVHPFPLFFFIFIHLPGLSLFFSLLLSCLYNGNLLPHQFDLQVSAFSFSLLSLPKSSIFFSPSSHIFLHLRFFKSFHLLPLLCIWSHSHHPLLTLNALFFLGPLLTHIFPLSPSIFLS